MSKQPKKLSDGQALRELSRRFPSVPEIDVQFKKAFEQPDRGIAITMTAIIERLVEHLVIKKLPAIHDDLRKDMFGDRGPLGNLSSKIMLAEALGVIGPHRAQDIHFIRRIRNVFAHAPGDITFDTPEIATAMEKPHIRKVLEGIKLTDGSKVRFEHKQIFLFITFFTANYLENQLHSLDGKGLLYDEPPASFGPVDHVV